MAAGQSERETTRALTDEVARQSIERLSEGLTRLAGETSAILRWLLGALLALNLSGFWLCLLRPDFLPREEAGALLGLFAAGVAAALVAGLLGLILTLPLGAALRRAVTAWTEVSASGDLSDEALASARRVRLFSGLWLGMTAFAGFASLLAFGMSATIIAARNQTAAQPVAAVSSAPEGKVPLVVAPVVKPVAKPAPRPVPTATPSPTPTPRITPSPRPSPSPSARPVRKAKREPESEPTPRAQRRKRNRAPVTPDASPSPPAAPEAGPSTSAGPQ